jgi:hypothetical protein
MRSARERRADVLMRGLSAVVGVLIGASMGACGDEEKGAPPDLEGLQMCCEIGARCHLEEGDPVNSLKQMCHSLGHENDPAKCRDQYDACIAECAGDSGEERHFCADDAVEEADESDRSPY